MGAVRVFLPILAAAGVATVSGIFCQSTLFTDSFVCDDGSDVGSNGCCASTNFCPSSCTSGASSTSNGVTTCTCTGCNFGFKLTSLTQDDRFLNAHNYFRCRHGQSLLAWDDDNAVEAADWASTCPSQGSNPAHIRPDGTSSYDLSPSRGENVAAGFQSVESAVEAWYSEITNPGYTPGTANQPPAGTGHYTAMIWAATTKLGCAENACSSGVPNPVHVCHYSEDPPNFGFDADYFENVPQSNTETATEDSCCASVYVTGDSEDAAGTTQAAGDVQEDDDADDAGGADDDAGGADDGNAGTTSAAGDVQEDEDDGDEPDPGADVASPGAAPRLLLWLGAGLFAWARAHEPV